MGPHPVAQVAKQFGTGRRHVQTLKNSEIGLKLRADQASKEHHAYTHNLIDKLN